MALTDRQCRQTHQPAVLIDGAGLRLKVSLTASGTLSKRWIVRYVVGGRRREVGLGSFPEVTLSEARAKAMELRKEVAAGADPLAEREQERREQAARVTFQECAEQYLKAHASSWRNPKHRAQWASTLATYAYPVFGALPVAEIAEPYVLAVLQPIWMTKPETATRVRQRIETVLDYARVCGHRPYGARNPATFKGNLEYALPKRPRTKAHHAALPWAEAPAFWQALTERTGAGADCLRFAILTAARSGEARGAIWGEIDLAEGVWAIPGERMKAKRPHRVPLSEPALAILRERRAMAGDPGPGDLVFLSDMKVGKPLSDMTLTAVLKRLGRGDLTQHGFRSSFRDWAAECTPFPREVAEQALAHTIENAVEAAYRRGDLFEKRRRLMDDWAGYVTSPTAEAGDNVRPLRRAVD